MFCIVKQVLFLAPTTYRCSSFCATTLLSINFSSSIPLPALIRALQWQPQAHLMHQLSGQDSSPAGRRLKKWDSSVPEHLDLEFMLMMTPIALWHSFCRLFAGAYSPPTLARLWSCCGLLSFSYSATISLSHCHSFEVKRLLGCNYLQEKISKTSVSSFVSTIQQSFLSHQDMN